MEYAYVQAGQENSFIWKTVEKGFNIQMPLIAKLRDENKVKVETLSESGLWFKEHYKVTPATSLTINSDLEREDVKTVWFNSRFYRANLFWENGTLRFRDIHIFNENLPSKYLNERVYSNECFFNTLPLVDGHVWSSPDEKAGLRLKASIDGKEFAITGGIPEITNPQPGVLHVSWPLETIRGTFIAELDERQIKLKMEGNDSTDWFWELTTYPEAELPFTTVNSALLECEFEGMNYSVKAERGSFLEPSGQVVFRIQPEDNTIILNLDNHQNNEK